MLVIEPLKDLMMDKDIAGGSRNKKRGVGRKMFLRIGTYKNMIIQIYSVI